MCGYVFICVHKYTYVYVCMNRGVGGSGHVYACVCMCASGCYCSDWSLLPPGASQGRWAELRRALQLAKSAPQGCFTACGLTEHKSELRSSEPWVLMGSHGKETLFAVASCTGSGGVRQKVWASAS